MYCCRAVARYMLLVHYNAGIQPVPPICPLNRRHLIKEDENQEKDQQAPNTGVEERNGFHVPMTVTLKRSGKTMRTLAMCE